MAATILPEIPMVNAGELYINGLQISNDATTPLTLIDVAAGACRDSTNINDIILSAPAVINIANTGALGIDFGTVAASTMYAVYVVGSSTNPAVLINVGQSSQTSYSAFPTTALISSNFSQPSLPAGYDMFRRIGTVVTDSSSHVLEFRQVASNGSGRAMYYGSAITVLTAGHATGFTAVNLNGLAPSVPVGLATSVFLASFFTPTAVGDEAYLQPTGASAASVYAFSIGDVAAVDNASSLICPCNASASISYKLTVNTDALTLAVQGFLDLL